MKRLLFVCVENSCRSQMAEAFCRRHGGGAVDAFSAGTQPSGVVHPKIMTCMGESGYDMSGHFSKGLADLADLEFDVAVAMGCAKPDGIHAHRFERWDFPAPKDLPLDQLRLVRDQIEQKVRQLLTRFTRAS